jgi:Fic family protein
MNLKLETEFSKADILQEVDALKKQIDDMRPLPEDVEGRVMQKLRLDWNYNSNAIEGNKLTYGETAAFLSEGITAKGKPLKDHLDIKGHNEAITFLLDIVKDSRPISEADIRTLHKMILVEPYDVKAQTSTGAPTTKRISLGEYKTSPNHVKTSTGELHYYATPEETPAKMQELMHWYYEVSNNTSVHPIVIAALFHHKFVAIHPFDDGNGRLSRVLMNLILMQKGFPPVVIKMDDRQNYYSLLRRADVGENWPFVEYITEGLQKSLQLYIKAANGGDIEEDDDIDKELALYRIELKTKINPKKKATKEEINRTISNVIYPLILKVESKLKMFNEFFQSIKYTFETNPVLENTIINNDVAEIGDRMYSIIRANRKINSMCLTINLNDFKNPENVFNISVQVDFEFDDTGYLIADTPRNWVLYKNYNEKLSVIDEKLIIKNIINDIKYWIDENFKE